MPATPLDDATRPEPGRAALRQPERDPVPAVEQLLVLLSAMEGMFDGMSETEVVAAMEKVRASVGDALAGVAARIADNQPLEEDDRASLLGVARAALGVPEDDRDADT